MASCIVLLNALRKDKKYKNKNVRFWVGGSQYMPAKSYAENARSHPLQGWKSLGVQFNHMHMHMQRFKHQSIFGIQYVCVDGERILNQVIFHLVELRPDSGIVSYWLGL